MITSYQSNASALLNSGNPAVAEDGHPYDVLARSKQLLINKDVKEGLKWFWIGMILLQQDVACTTDLSVTGILDNAFMQFQYGYFTRINFTTHDMKAAKEAAIIWVKTHEIESDPKWITSFGINSWVEQLGGKSSGSSLYPKDEWPKLRTDALKRFMI